MTQIHWSYDSLNRLSEEVFTSDDPSLNLTYDYVYDLVGNRLKKTVDVGNDSIIDQVFVDGYDDNDRLLTGTVDQNNDSVVDETTTFGYQGTQQASESVTAGGVLQSQTTYGYNDRGRLVTVTVDSFQDGDLSRRVQTTYGYDETGTRVSTLVEVDPDGTGPFQTRTLTRYLHDPASPTGYSHALEEVVTDATTGELQQTVVYSVGLQAITQTTTPYTNGQAGTPTTLVLGFDGHGSTRVLYDMTAAIATIAGVRQEFTYEAFGNLLNMAAAQAATSLLYSGEMFDAATGLQNLRARWYQPSVGRFTQLDPFFGTLEDPQSLHKYLYVHADPVNGIDPSGLEFTISGIVSALNVQMGNRGKDAAASVRTLQMARRLRRLSNVYQKVMELYDKVHGIYSWVTDIVELLNFDDDAIEYLKGELSGLLAGKVVKLPKAKLPIPIKLPAAALEKVKALAGKLYLSPGYWDKAQEIAGELGTALIINLLGFTQSPQHWSWHATQGPDQVAQQKKLGLWGIFEAKGGNAPLGTGFGGQMSGTWLEHWIPIIVENNKGKEAKDLKEAFIYKMPMLAAIVRVNVFDPSVQLRITVQTYTPPTKIGKWGTEPGKDY